MYRCFLVLVRLACLQSSSSYVYRWLGALDVRSVVNSGLWNTLPVVVAVAIGSNDHDIETDDRCSSKKSFPSASRRHRPSQVYADQFIVTKWTTDRNDRSGRACPVWLGLWNVTVSRLPLYRRPGRSTTTTRRCSERTRDRILADNVRIEPLNRKSGRSNGLLQLQLVCWMATLVAGRNNNIDSGLMIMRSTVRQLKSDLN